MVQAAVEHARQRSACHPGYVACQVLSDPGLFAVEREAFLEALAVMRALGLRPVALPSYPVPLLVWAVQKLPERILRPVLRRLIASGRGEKRPSLQIDLELKRERSEVSYLNGAIASQAERLGLDAPVNRALEHTLLGIACGRLPWSEFQGRPERLLAVVHAEKGI
jgi:2-dehydropantoate 2-reductase